MGELNYMFHSPREVNWKARAYIETNTIYDSARPKVQVILPRKLKDKTAIMFAAFMGGILILVSLKFFIS